MKNYSGSDFFCFFSLFPPPLPPDTHSSVSSADSSPNLGEQKGGRRGEQKGERWAAAVPSIEGGGRGRGVLGVGCVVAATGGGVFWWLGWRLEAEDAGGAGTRGGDD